MNPTNMSIFHAKNVRKADELPSVQKSDKVDRRLVVMLATPAERLSTAASMDDLNVDRRLVVMQATSVERLSTAASMEDLNVDRRLVVMQQPLSMGVEKCDISKGDVVPVDRRLVIMNECQ
jgi:hypothetical protein